MRSLAIALMILSLATVAQADEIFRYVTEDGVVSFTDSEKLIPARYKDEAEKLVLGPFKDYERLTISTVKYEEVTPAPARVTVENPNRVEECDGPVTVTSERRQNGEYNREIYLVHDECGNLVSETFYQPEIRINR